MQTLIGVTIHPYGGTAVISVIGEIDISTVTELDLEIETAMAAFGSAVVIDLTETTFLDSTALRLLLRTYRRCQGAAGQLRVVSPNFLATRIFQITGLNRSIAIFPTLEDALWDAGDRMPVVEHLPTTAEPVVV